jgi:hypothetical protein
VHEHELLRLLREIDRKLDIIMTTPQTPQQVIDQVSASLEAAAGVLTDVAAALPGLLATAGTPVDTSALVTQVTAVINASNAIVALLPAGTVPPPPAPPAASGS